MVAWHWIQGAGLPWGFPMFAMSLFWIMLLAILVVGAVALLRPARRPDGSAGAGTDTALEIVRQRYARGEIDAVEYEERMRRLS